MNLTGWDMNTNLTGCGISVELTNEIEISNESDRLVLLILQIISLTDFFTFARKRNIIPAAGFVKSFTWSFNFLTSKPLNFLTS